MTNDHLIRAVEQAHTPSSMVIAVQNLVAAKNPQAIPTLIAVFGYNNPAAAAIAVTGLVELGFVAVPDLLANIDEYNYGARAYSIRTLAAIGDPRAQELLLAAAATDFSPSVRRAAAKGLGTMNWDKLEESNRLEAQTQAMESLFCLTQDTDWSIRYAAVVGLQALGKIPHLQPAIEAKFTQLLKDDTQSSVRARVQLAQQPTAS